VESHPATQFLVGVVGPCGAGKSSLVAGLQERGYRCSHIAQEHSYVQTMWSKIGKPDVLIFLEASFATCTSRRKLNWLEADYEEQRRRLAHARAQADLVIRTDDISVEDVRRQALDYLEAWPPR
jgi:deoxyadenosine/deoxycytidine kinase